MKDKMAGLRGTVHCHTTHSFDGTMDHAQLREYFLERGLRFVCLTEHIEYLDQGKVNAIFEACEANSDDEFLFIPGMEMDYFKIYFLGLKPCEVDFTDHRSQFESMLPHAEMCVFSHPIKARYDYPQWLIDLCDGVEILNTKHDGRHYFRPQSEKLLERVRRQRPSTIGLAGMDFHGPKQYSATHLVLRNPISLTREAVLHELRAGAFDIEMAGRRLADVSPSERAVLRARIHMMDFAHWTNKKLANAGFRLPKALKRMLRKGMEGA